MPKGFAFLHQSPKPPFSKGGRGGISKSFRSVKEFWRAVISNNLAKEISGLRDLIGNKNRKGLSIISEMVEIPFEFHEGIRFDNVDDLFDRNFLCQIPPFPPLLKGG